MTIQTYTVEGMTCGHCAAAVSREVGTLPGVSDPRVDIAAKTLTFSAESAVSDDAVAAAVAEAGYTLAGRA
jgi:copper chaperone CopZ